MTLPLGAVIQAQQPWFMWPQGGRWAFQKMVEFTVLCCGKATERTHLDFPRLIHTSSLPSPLVVLLGLLSTGHPSVSLP